MTRLSTVRATALASILAFTTVIHLPREGRADYLTPAGFGANTPGSPRLGFVDSGGNPHGSIRIQLPGYEQYRVTSFEVRHGSGVVTPLASTSGYKLSVYPGVAVDRAGNLYAASRTGSGPFGFEQRLEVKKGSGVVTPGPIVDTAPVFGQGSQSLTIDGQGNLFATTLQGGTAPDLGGTLLELKHGASRFNLLNDFSAAGAVHPSPDLATDHAGNVYGTTSGSVFEWNKRTGRVTTLAQTNLVGTKSLVIDHAGNLYGLTGSGGAHNAGVLFELKKGTRSITTLLDLGATAQPPLSILRVDKAGNVFGLGSNGDSIVELKKGAGSFTTVVAAGSSRAINLPTNFVAANSIPTPGTDAGAAPLAVPNGGGVHAFQVDTPPLSVPELDPGALNGGLTILIGGLLTLLDRRTRDRVRHAV